MVQVFLLSVFIICFRESLEAAVIVSVLLAFVKQSFGGPNRDRKIYRRLLWHVWLGSLLGFFICMCVGGGFIGAFYAFGNDIWGAKEDLWEGILSIVASVMISAMGMGMLRMEKMKEKWRLKISQVILEGGVDDDLEHGPKAGKWDWVKKLNPKKLNPLQFRFSKLGRWTRKYALFLLPFITVLREGIELVVGVAGVSGVSIGIDARSYPLSVVLGLLCGFGAGYLIYLGGNFLSMRYFLIGSTCLLYLIAAGLFSRCIWYLQMYVYSQQTGGDVAENGSGPGSYNIAQSVWHVNCCNPELNNNGWGIFNALFGWQNSATYGSVISYNCYWIFIMAVVACLIYVEKTGQYPIIGRWIKRKEVTREKAAELYERAQAHLEAQMALATNKTENHGVMEDNFVENSLEDDELPEKKNREPLMRTNSERTSSSSSH